MPTDLSKILETLAACNVAFILVGGLAAVAQGAPVTTFDVDIVPRQTDANLGRLMDCLKSLQAVHRRPDDTVLPARLHDLTGRGHNLYTTRFGPLDVLGRIEQGLGYDDLVEKTITVSFRSHQIKVLSLQAIIELKRDSSSPEDRRRLPVLEQTLEQSPRHHD